MRACCLLLQELLVKHKEDVRKVAERLLEVETISQHDLTELVGVRPFATDVRTPSLPLYLSPSLPLPPYFSVSRIPFHFIDPFTQCCYCVQAHVNEYVNASWTEGEAKK